MATENKEEQCLSNLNKLRENESGSLLATVEYLKAQLGELKTVIKARDEELRRVKVNAAVDAALMAAGARNIIAVKALIEGIDKMELLKDGSVMGLAEKIDAIKKSDGYLFEQRGGKVTIRGAKPCESGYDSVDGAADISKMTYSQMAEFIKKNPSAKVFD